MPHCLISPKTPIEQIVEKGTIGTLNTDKYKYVHVGEKQKHGYKRVKKTMNSQR
jgi:hypothetical protein